jgi:hypothetical protein
MEIQAILEAVREILLVIVSLVGAITTLMVTVGAILKIVKRIKKS